jgi:hypothetical protein
MKRGYFNISVHSAHEHKHDNTVLANNEEYTATTHTHSRKCPADYLSPSVF